MAKDSCYWDIEIAWIESLHPLLFNSRDCREKCLSGVFSACFSLVRLHHGDTACSNNAAIHLAPPFTRVASDLIVQSFIAPVHGICLEYKQTWMYQVYYTVCNENNMLEITFESLRTESSKLSMTVQICSADWMGRDLHVIRCSAYVMFGSIDLVQYWRLPLKAGMARYRISFWMAIVPA